MGHEAGTLSVEKEGGFNGGNTGNAGWSMTRGGHTFPPLAWWIHAQCTTSWGHTFCLQWDGDTKLGVKRPGVYSGSL